MITIELCDDNAKMPTRGTKESAGWDLYCCEEFAINTGEVRIINTGIKIEIPQKHVCLLRGRSGLALQGIDCMEFTNPDTNKVLGGVIDSDYRGVIGVILKNLGALRKEFKKWDRIAQMIILPINTDELVEGKVGMTERGMKGFGSSDEKFGSSDEKLDEKIEFMNPRIPDSRIPDPRIPDPTIYLKGK